MTPALCCANDPSQGGGQLSDGNRQRGDRRTGAPVATVARQSTVGCPPAVSSVASRVAVITDTRAVMGVDVPGRTRTYNG